MQELTKGTDLFKIINELNEDLENNQAVASGQIFKYGDKIVQIEIVKDPSWLNDCRESDFWQAVEDQIRIFYDSGEIEKAHTLREFQENNSLSTNEKELL